MKLTREYFEENFGNPNYKELYDLKGAIQSEKWHPEGDAYEHTLMVLDKANKLFPQDNLVKLSAICHDFGKALTKPIWPKHHNHENLGIKPTENFLSRNGVSRSNIIAAKFATKYHMHIHKAFELRPVTYLKIYKDIEDGRFYFEEYDIHKYGYFVSYNRIVNLIANLGVCDHYGRGGVSQYEQYNNPLLFATILELIAEKMEEDDFTDQYMIKYISSKLHDLKSIYNHSKG